MRPRRPVPADFATVAPTIPVSQARTHWRTAHAQIQRWEAETGVRCARLKPGRPAPGAAVAKAAVRRSTAVA